jgi:hypothetical protein
VKNNLQKMAEQMPEENYSFKVTPDVRTFSGGENRGDVGPAQTLPFVKQPPCTSAMAWLAVVSASSF